MPISYFNFSSSATPIFVSSSQRFIHRSVVWPDGDGTSLRVHCKQRFLSCTAFSVKEVVRVALCGVVGLFTPRFSWGVLTLSLPECLIEFCEVTLTFESVDEILWCDHSNESSLPVLTHGAICFSKFHKMKFGHLVEICFWLNLAVKGLNKPTWWLTSDANDFVNAIKAARERNLCWHGSH